MHHHRSRSTTALRSLLAVGLASALVAACSESSTPSSAERDSGSAAPEAEGGRPPLPRTAPSGPAVDRHIEEPPPDFDPVAWTDLPPRLAMEGPLAVNELLTGAEIHGEDQLDRPEDVAPGLDGHLYTGTRDGGVWRVVLDDDGAVDDVERVATLDGPVLGLDAYTEDVIVAAVPTRGVVAVDTETGENWVLTDRLDGNLIHFPDGLAVAADGTIYFTEASTLYDSGFPYEFLDGRPHGRLLRYEPSTGETDVVADDMYFANGVVVAPDESYALVAESFRFRITRVWLDGDREGTTEQFGANLINGPDNIRMDDQGRVWVGGDTMRSDTVDAVLTNAELRRQLAALTPEEQDAARAEAGGDPYGFAQVLDPGGAPIFSFHDPTGSYSVSAVLPHDGFVTFGSLDDDGVARIPMPTELAG